MKGGLFIGPAAAFERAGFDYLLVEDTSMIEDAHGGSMEPMLYTIDGTAGSCPASSPRGLRSPSPPGSQRRNPGGTAKPTT